MRTRYTTFVFALLLTALATTTPFSRSTWADESDVLNIGSRLEMFVDRYLIDRLDGAELKLHAPLAEEKVLTFERPWEGNYCGYLSVIFNGEKYQMYYRGKTNPSADGAPDEVTCYAESADGIHWVKPNLALFEVHGTRDNNVVLDDSFAPVSHNFGVFLDTRPGTADQERYKGLGGLFDMKGHRSSGGLVALVSPDGIHWKKLRDKAVINHSHYPHRHTDACQPSAFWSESEEQYVCYIRAWKNFGKAKFRDGWGGDCRWIGRTTSPDFINWSMVELMEYTPDDFPDQLYLPQTQSYVRAPHIYLAITARLSDHRLVVTPEQARALGVPKNCWRDTSDAILMTSRGGTHYDRTFMSSFIRPGLGPQNWVTRCSYPALGVVQTGPTELSLYLDRDNAQSTAHLRRYTLRLDGFASVHAPYEGGEMITRPLKFAGNELVINFATSASGAIRCEIQNAKDDPIPGFALDNCKEIGGDEIERTVRWVGGSDVSRLRDQPIRLRFVMKDADLFALRFKK